MRLSASSTNSRQSIAALLATPVCITVSSMSETTTTRARGRRDVDVGAGGDGLGRLHGELEPVPDPVGGHRPARRHLDAEIAVVVGLDQALGAIEAGADARRAHRPPADAAEHVAQLALLPPRRSAARRRGR